MPHGCVRYEDVEQTVPGDSPGEELFAVVRQVGDGLRRSGGDVQDTGGEGTGHVSILSLMRRDRASTCRDIIDLLSRGSPTFSAMFRSALLTSRGHVDLLRVASAACCPGY